MEHGSSLQQCLLACRVHVKELLLRLPSLPCLPVPLLSALKMRHFGGLVIVIMGLSLGSAQTMNHLFYNEEDYPLIPEYGPQPNPPYMMDNQENYYNVAPDKGEPRPESYIYALGQV